LITRQIIEQITLAHAFHAALPAGNVPSDLVPPKSAGFGIGLGFALFGMEMIASLCNYQAQQRGWVIGFMMRSAVSVVRACKYRADKITVDRPDVEKVHVGFETGIPSVYICSYPLTGNRKLSGKARLEMTNGRLTNMVATDASFLVCMLLRPC
jgi:ATP-binding cassette subfamily C (CFTR/MRP) protein 1